MTVSREQLKTVAAAMLGELGVGHPLGHQASKARRYVISAPDGTELQIMFQQDEDSPPNVWVLEQAAGALAARAKPYPRSALWTKTGKDGNPVYGRHSALESMLQLGDADLACFAPTTLEELGAIFDQLLAASAARVAP